MQQTALRHFDVICKLGEGSFSCVYKVQRTDDKQFYAMKKVKIGQMREKEKENALNEVRILASITHPNIVNYKEAFFDEKTQTLCIVMELADAGDIQGKVTAHAKHHTHFTESEIWQALIQSLRGLKALHEANILHRDLKCANVFCTSEGRFKLGDLNVSKVAKRGMARTQTGTPYYTSPEVWDDKPYDSKCDIWSLGCVVYEMASLRPPFKATNLKELYAKIKRGIYESIPSFYSDELSMVIAQCLKVNPTQRPSAVELLKSSVLNRHTLPSDILNQHNSETSKYSLLKTIMVPKNLKSLKDALPASKYGCEDPKMRRAHSANQFLRPEQKQLNNNGQADQKYIQSNSRPLNSIREGQKKYVRFEQKPSNNNGEGDQKYIQLNPRPLNSNREGQKRYVEPSARPLHSNRQGQPRYILPFLYNKASNEGRIINRNPIEQPPPQRNNSMDQMRKKDRSRENSIEYDKKNYNKEKIREELDQYKLYRKDPIKATPIRADNIKAYPSRIIRVDSSKSIREQRMDSRQGKINSEREMRRDSSKEMLKPRMEVENEKAVPSRSKQKMDSITNRCKEIEARVKLLMDNKQKNREGPSRQICSNQQQENYRQKIAIIQKKYAYYHRPVRRDSFQKHYSEISNRRNKSLEQAGGSAIQKRPSDRSFEKKPSERSFEKRAQRIDSKKKFYYPVMLPPRKQY